MPHWNHPALEPLRLGPVNSERLVFRSGIRPLTEYEREFYEDLNRVEERYQQLAEEREEEPTAAIQLKTVELNENYHFVRGRLERKYE